MPLPVYQTTKLNGPLLFNQSHSKRWTGRDRYGRAIDLASP